MNRSNNEFAVGDEVIFSPKLGDEHYVHAVPEVGSIGTVLSVKIDPSFLLIWQIVLLMCEVKFADIENPIFIYTEDLKHSKVNN